ncbi:YCF48-related protein [Nocardia sp. alder85J]|uniref:YCF48-related protein n=1 Tax=Nocardia sp. alder85J TaxID=2862949 RepID=UPI001CD77FB0|nr:YCF48-related protein [Nocardia sp. alder85J]MCX4091379.1 hypothetical protein [Nocardia sp. alder85J]
MAAVVALVVVVTVTVVGLAGHRSPAAVANQVVAEPSSTSGGGAPWFAPIAVSAPAPEQMWVLGTRGPCAAGTSCPQLEHSADGGRSWRTMPTPDADMTAPGGVPSTWAGVTFADPSAGWVYGGGLWSTRDGGITWQPKPLPDNAGAYWQFTFADRDNGWATGARHLWSTHDGGTTWRRVDIPGERWSVAVDGSTVRTATVDGDAEIRVSSSPIGADDWTVADLGRHAPAGGPVLPSVTARGGHAWVIVQGRGTIATMRTVGGHWQDWTAPHCGGNGVGTLDATSAGPIYLVCGRPGPAESRTGEQVFVSTDGGDSFTGTSTLWPQVADVYLMSAGPGHLVAAVSDTSAGARLLLSADASRSWQPVYAGSPRTSIGGGEFVSPTAGYVLLQDELGANRLLLTADGGRTWAEAGFAD